MGTQIRGFLIGLPLAVLLSSTLAQGIETTVLPEDPLRAVAAMPVVRALRAGRAIEVRTVDGEPIAGAIVIALDWTASDVIRVREAAERLHPGDEPRVLAAMSTCGIRHPVRDDGTALVPEGAVGVVAVHGDRIISTLGVQLLGGGADPIVLTPRAARTCSVAVIDADGAPAPGVIVGLSIEPEKLPFAGARTDAAGRATLRALAGRLPAVHVRAAVASRRPLSAALPHEEGVDVLLQLPPSGRIRATLSDEVAPGSSTRWELRANDGGTRAAQVSADPRSVVFDHVEAGFAGGLSCLRENRGWIGLGIGEVPAGGDWVVEVPSWGKLIALRVLDGQGKPARRAEVRCRWSSKDRERDRVRTETNPMGWLELLVPEGGKQGDRVELELRSPDGDRALLGVGEVAVGRLDAVRTVAGDLQVTVPEVALRGRVVDGSGRGVGGLAFRAIGSSWHYPTRTTADGSFTLSMPEPVPRELTLELDDPWRFNESNESRLSMPSGTTEARVVVQAAGRVLVVARGLSREALGAFQVRAEPADASTRPLPDDSSELPLDDLMLPAGTWDLVLLLHGTEVDRIASVRTEAFVETHDARLLDLDWRRYGTLVTVRLEDERGEPTDAAEVCFSLYPETACTGRPDAGVVRFLAPKKGVRTSVHPRDGQKAPIDLGVVTGEQLVRIGGGVTLTTRFSLPPLPPGTQVMIDLGLEGLPCGLDCVPLPASESSIRFRAVRPGAYVFWLGLLRNNKKQFLKWKVVEVGNEDADVEFAVDARLRAEIERATAGR